MDKDVRENAPVLTIHGFYALVGAEIEQHLIIRTGNCLRAGENSHDCEHYNVRSYDCAGRWSYISGLRLFWGSTFQSQFLSRDLQIQNVP